MQSQLFRPLFLNLSPRALWVIHRIVSKIHEVNVQNRRGAASKFRAPPETPQHPFALKGRQPVFNRWEVAVLKVHFNGKPGKGFSALEAVANRGNCSPSPARLSKWVALLAMKHGRAPLPVSRTLEKALVRQGLVYDPSELGDFARRYLFLGDARILLAESRKRPTSIANSLELVKPSNAEGQTKPETGVPYQCL